MEAQSTNGRRLQLNTTDTDLETTNKRLNWLLAANAETAHQKNLYRNERERDQALLMRRPVSSEKSLATLGLLLGSLPPASIFTKFLISTYDPSIFVALFLVFVTSVTTVTGYFSGILLGKIIIDIEKMSRSARALLLPLIGIAWGGVCGTAGGIFIFIVGAFFGTLIGGAVGAVALPVFVFLHTLLKKGDMMELRHLLPVAFGITLTICAAIAGR